MAAGKRSPQDKQIRATSFWKSSYSWVVLATIVACLLHFWRLDAKSIWWDESLSLYRAQQDLSGILSNRIEFPGSITTDLHPPLYFVVLRLATQLWGDSDVALRLLSALFAALIVPLLYVMGERLGTKRTGILAAWAGAVSPFYLWYAQEARMYTMVTALSLAAGYMLWRGLEERQWPWLVAGGLISALALGTNYLYGLILVALVCVAIIGWWGGKARPQRDTLSKGQRFLVIAGLGILLLTLVLASITVARLAPTLNAGRAYVSPWIILRDALNSFAIGVSADMSRMWPFDVLAALAYLIGVSTWFAGHRGSRMRWPGMLLLTATIVIPVAGMWVFSLLFSFLYMGSRYMMASSPFFYVAVALGLDAAWRRRKAFALFVGVLLMVGVSVSTYRYFYHPRYQAKEDYRSAADYVREYERPGDAIIVTAPENLPAFSHYYSGALSVYGMPRYALTGGPDPVQVTEDLQQFSEEYERLWFVHCRTMFSDPQDLVLAGLSANMLLLERSVFPSYGSEVVLSAFQTEPVTVSEVLTGDPIGTFGSQLALVSCQLRYSGGVDARRDCCWSAENDEADLEPIASGQTLMADLVWRVDEPLGDYKTSLRLVDGDGRLWAQHDAVPYLYWPTSEWGLGQFVRSAASVRIAPGTPPGLYQLQLWIYSEDTGQALPFEPGDRTESRLYGVLGDVSVGIGSEVWLRDAFVPASADIPFWPIGFGGQVELLAYDLAPENVSPGREAEARLYWRARRDISQELQLVVNWQDSHGSVWHTQTTSLVGRYATDQWQEGQVVWGIITLTVPEDAPSGLHQLSLLVRDEASGDLLWQSRGSLPWPSHNHVIGSVRVK